MSGADRPLVVCRGAALTFGSGSTSVVAVHGATCAVYPGDRIAIAGASGSGKSTLLHLLAGLERTTSGTVTWPGLLGEHTTDTPATGTVGLVFQSPSLIPTLTVSENVALPLHLQGLEPTDIEARSALSLAQVHATQLSDKLPEELSGGQAQRVAVARVLAMRPRLILADEPTGQLDHTSGRRVIDALLTAADQIGAALVVTTHDTAVSSQLSTRWSIQEGRLNAPEPAGVDA